MKHKTLYLMAIYLQGILQSKKLKVDGIGGYLKGIVSTAPVYNELQLIKCSQKKSTYCYSNQ